MPRSSPEGAARLRAVRRTPPRPPLSRDAIVATARRLLAADGLEALSLRRVARELGVTAPALYAHVDDKLALLRAVAEGEFARLAERFETAAGAPDPLARIRANARAYVGYARENPELFRVMFLFRPRLTAVPRGDELPLATRTFEAGAAAVAEASAAGAIRRADPLLASLALWTAIHGLASVFLLGVELGAEQEERLVDCVIESLLEGLAQPPEA